MNQCPICLAYEAINLLDVEKGKYVDCTKCGKYEITNEAYDFLSDEDRTKISALLRERKLKKLNPLAIFMEKQKGIADSFEFPLRAVDQLLNEFPESISERLDRALVNLANLSNHPGERIEMPSEDKQLFFVKSSTYEEYKFLRNQLEVEELIDYSSATSRGKLTVKGWNRVAKYETILNEDTKNAFVAMWFNEEVDNAYENAISKAIKDAGYNPIRIDKVDHNNKICDEIIAEIKKSKFVIADFTGHRGGVYFEAGYAMGLGKPVIWTCKHDHLDNLHFDTRQYSHIVWESEDDLYEKLLNRIKATIN